MTFTERELEILRLIAAGHQPRQIAAKLGISPQTVKSHLSSMFYKAGAKTQSHLVALAWVYGLIGPDDLAGA